MRRILRSLGAGIAPPAGSEGLDILVTNDDGIAAPGLQTLAAVLAAAGHEVTVVAPIRPSPAPAPPTRRPLPSWPG